MQNGQTKAPKSKGQLNEGKKTDRLKINTFALEPSGQQANQNIKRQP